jgi:hypothetical protein
MQTCPEVLKERLNVDGVPQRVELLPRRVKQQRQGNGEVPLLASKYSDGISSKYSDGISSKYSNGISSTQAEALAKVSRMRA